MTNVLVAVVVVDICGPRRALTSCLGIHDYIKVPGLKSMSISPISCSLERVLVEGTPP